MNFQKLVLGTALASLLGFSSTAAMAAETVTLRMSTWLPPKHQIVTGSLEPWFESIKEASGGTLIIKLDPAPIAKPPGQYDIVKNGAADLAYHIAGYTPGPFEVMRGVELPFLSPNATVGSQAAFEWYDQNVGFDSEFKDVKVITLMVHGPGMVHSKKPVASLEDLANLKLRVGGGGVRLSEALGATPVVMSGSQAYEAIQKGVAEGAMFPFEAVAGYKLSELVDYHLEIPGGLYTTPFVILMNPDKYESLSDEHKAVLKKTGGVAGAAILGRGWDDADKNGRAAAEEAGNTITVLPDAELARFKDAAQSVTDAWIELANERGHDGPALYQALVDTMNKYAAAQ